MRDIAEIQADIERCKKCKHPFCTSICENCDAIYGNNLGTLLQKFIDTLTTGIPLDRLEQMCEAYKLIGMTVYTLLELDEEKSIETTIITHYQVNAEGVSVYDDYYDGRVCYVNQLGGKIGGYKTVFLTQEEAEKALEGIKCCRG